jgi:hypothetical protein
LLLREDQQRILECYRTLRLRCIAGAVSPALYRRLLRCENSEQRG